MISKKLSFAFKLLLAKILTIPLQSIGVVYHLTPAYKNRDNFWR